MEWDLGSRIHPPYKANNLEMIKIKGENQKCIVNLQKKGKIPIGKKNIHAQHKELA